MPKLVAHYVREFSYRNTGETSTLYTFVFCLCLPFISRTFRRARLIALAIAECTNSEDQIIRVREKISVARVLSKTTYSDEYYAQYSGSVGDVPDFYYEAHDKEEALVPYRGEANNVRFTIKLNGATQTEIEAYLVLLIPFYVELDIVFIP